MSAKSLSAIATLPYFQREGAISGVWTYDQLDSISERGIHQASDGLTQLDRDLFCRKGEDGSQGDDGEEVERKDPCWGPAQYTGDEANGNEEYEDINRTCIGWLLRQLFVVGGNLCRRACETEAEAKDGVRRAGARQRSEARLQSGWAGDRSKEGQADCNYYRRHVGVWKLTAEKRDLDDMPSVGGSLDGEVMAIVAGCVVDVE
jgi:hypothetical protein